MIPVSFDESEEALSKPGDMTHDECQALSVWRGPMIVPTVEESPCYNPAKPDEPTHTYQNGSCTKCAASEFHDCVISCWKMTREELQTIQKTGRVWLVVLGQTMPPVMILGEKPQFPDS